MSRDDDSSGWSGADKSPLVVVHPRAEGSNAVAATRTAGSLLLIIFMLAAVIWLVLAIVMQADYKHDLAEQIETKPEARCIVAYQSGLEEARRDNSFDNARALTPPNGPPPVLAYDVSLPVGRCDTLETWRAGAPLTGAHPQLEFDRLRGHNATLRKNNNDRVAAEDHARNARRPTQRGLPGLPGGG